MRKQLVSREVAAAERKCHVEEQGKLLSRIPRALCIASIPRFDDAMPIETPPATAARRNEIPTIKGACPRT